jgi:hypothetical protein
MYVTGSFLENDIPILCNSRLEYSTAIEVTKSSLNDEAILETFNG